MCNQIEALFEHFILHPCISETCIRPALIMKYTVIIGKVIRPEGGAVGSHELHHFPHCISPQTDLFNDLFINSASFTNVLLMYVQCLHMPDLTTFSASAVLSSNLALFHKITDILNQEYLLLMDCYMMARLIGFF